jgi:peptidoglycan/LPS O-acetylase OafA/YrhL
MLGGYAGSIAPSIMLEFMYGIVLHNIRNRVRHSFKLVSILLCIGATFFVLVYFETFEKSFSYNYRFIVFGIPASVIVFGFVALEDCLVKSPPSLVRLITFLGDSSYSIYLTHWFVIVLVRKVIITEKHIDFYFSAMGFLFTFFSIVLTGIITFLYIDLPLQKRFKLASVRRIEQSS